MSTLSQLASLQNVSNGKYRCHSAGSLQTAYTSPGCLFQLIGKGLADGVDSYAIKNIQNNEYFNDRITSMTATADTKNQHWKFVKLPNTTYTIQNAGNGGYMTSKAGSLHHGTPGHEQEWSVDSRLPGASASSWMTDNWSLVHNRRLTRICMPGSHDSGTFDEEKETAFGSVRNTRTQLFDIGLQLIQGVRVLDLRPAIYRTKFYTAHWSVVGSLGYQGAIGVSLATAFDQIAEFVAKDENRCELIVLNFSHFINWDERDTVPHLNSHQKQAFSNLVLDRLSNRLICGATDALRTGTLETLIGRGPDRRNVVAVSPTFEQNETEAMRGLWNPSYFLPTHGEYSKTNDLHKMRKGQLDNMRMYDRAGGDFMFELCWQLTLSDTQSAVAGSSSILDLAEKANPDLRPTVEDWIRAKQITRDYYPNVITADACDDSVTAAVKLSLDICGMLDA